MEDLMREKFGIMFIIVACLILFIAGCSDKESTQPTADETCLTCHADDSNIRVIDAEWRNSIHASGNNINRNTPPCSGCHTSQGFMERISTGLPDTVPEPGVISCFTCHEPHTNKNFNLRTDTPVALLLGGTFNMGLGNLCANCHQGRVPSPSLPALPGDSIRITSAFWGPHDGPQANVLAGLDAYVFPGAVYHNSPHTTLVTDGCPTCHMSTPFKNIAGAHSMNMTYVSNGNDVDLTTGCNRDGCHSGLNDFNNNGAQDTVDAATAALRTILLADSMLSPTDPSFRTVKTPIKISGTQAGALYNYLLVTEERSHGVHNTQFDLDILNASINALGH